MSALCLKVKFPDAEAAGRALEDARLLRSKGRGKKGRVECRYYWHAPCAAFHLTSMRKA